MICKIPFSITDVKDLFGINLNLRNIMSKRDILFGTLREQEKKKRKKKLGCSEYYEGEIR